MDERVPLSFYFHLLRETFSTESQKADIPGFVTKLKIYQNPKKCFTFFFLHKIQHIIMEYIRPTFEGMQQERMKR